ncbi:MAG TPA: bifunctional phosphoribosyl-AMP cyclohydrolase/phosphoribosyl-ATP diphosphatase HisIE [Candidatus Baltobacteraceae bacterium]|nr:bifunctional phosphoribosyl-AMP cyclohydrolase/phosphoribosyl-ATP diphosphatase HisIE [Candidatus Baltobacteraceae bacterium]
MDELKWNADGLLPVVIADARTNAVLTLAYANREALEKTIAERSTYLFSRSRRKLWHKGEESGNTQELIEVAYDCDADALLYRVIPSGPACHTGAKSCFHNSLLRHAQDDRGTASQRDACHAEESKHGRGIEAPTFAKAIAHLETVLEQRKGADPASSYVAKLYGGGVDKIGKKIGEEATEVVIAAKNASHDELVWEAADLIFHLLVLLQAANVPIDDVGGELLRRAK